jgi:hypothetical protein
MNIYVRKLQQHLGAFMDRILSKDQLAKGVEEGWVAPPQKVGRLGTPLRLKVKRRSIDVLNEDRGEELPSQ